MTTRSLRHVEKERAFRQLFNDYYAPFCLWSKRFIESREEREDIVSEVFAMLWEHWDKGDFDPRRDEAVGYIKMCVRNACLNRVKHLIVEGDYADAYQDAVSGYEPAGDDVYTVEALYKMLNDTLEQLPDSHRLVFLKSFYEGKTREEIAEELNVSAKSVGRYKKKVIELLRKHFKEYMTVALLLLYLSAEP